MDLELARTTYCGYNDSHLAEALAEDEGISIARSSLRRLLRAEGLPSPRKRRPPRNRSRRERMAQAGLLVQVDGSRHDWLEGRGPWLTLVGGIDDATGIVVGATFRDAEDGVGYLTVLRDMARRYGLPAAIYRDGSTIFAPNAPARRSATRRPRSGGRSPSSGSPRSCPAQATRSGARRSWSTTEASTRARISSSRRRFLASQARE